MTHSFNVASVHFLCPKKKFNIILLRRRRQRSMDAEYSVLVDCKATENA